MLDQANQDTAHGSEADARATRLRDDDEYASLKRRAVTDNSNELVTEVVRLITETETRKRQRVSRAGAFREAVEGFLGDLLAAGEGWVYRPTGHGRFTKRTGHSRSANDGVSPRSFIAVRRGLQKLGLLNEVL